MTLQSFSFSLNCCDKSLVTSMDFSRGKDETLRQGRSRSREIVSSGFVPSYNGVFGFSLSESLLSSFFSEPLYEKPYRHSSHHRKNSRESDGTTIPSKTSYNRRLFRWISSVSTLRRTKNLLRPTFRPLTYRRPPFGPTSSRKESRHFTCMYAPISRWVFVLRTRSQVPRNLSKSIPHPG